MSHTQVRADEATTYHEENNYGLYVCIEVALHGDAHGIGRSNWAKGRDTHAGSYLRIYMRFLSRL